MHSLTVHNNFFKRFNKLILRVIKLQIKQTFLAKRFKMSTTSNTVTQKRNLIGDEIVLKEAVWYDIFVIVNQYIYFHKSVRNYCVLSLQLVYPARCSHLLLPEDKIIICHIFVFCKPHIKWPRYQISINTSKSHR